MKRLLPIVSALKGLSLPRWGAAFACLALAGCMDVQNDTLSNSSKPWVQAGDNLIRFDDAEKGVSCYIETAHLGFMSCVRIPQRPAIIGLQGGDIAKSVAR